MMIFIKLLLAHLLGDFLWQPNKWVEDKEIKKHKSRYLYIHTFLHFLLAWILVADFAFGWFALVLALSHGVIDFLKLKFQKKENRITWFLVDQWLHLAVIVLLTFIWTNQITNFDSFTKAVSDLFGATHFFTKYIWLYGTATLFLTKPASIIIKNIISIWTPESEMDKSDDSLQNAGNVIGILERLFVFYFVVNGNYEAIGFLLAAKSIFRFGDLKEAKDRKLTEYVLIGTLLSFGIAFAVALLVNFSLIFG
jgi:hypothetical protein